jgi:hypothetical protein
MVKVKILSPMIGSGTSLVDAYRPKVATLAVEGAFRYHAPEPTARDKAIMEQHPGLTLVEVECEQSVLDAIMADPDYVVL